MSSAFNRRVATCAIAIVAATTPAAQVQPVHASGPSALRVCADPNNLPFSNQREQGFENRIARLIGRQLGRPIEYYWQPQRRGFVRTTIGAGHCELIIGVPASFNALAVTRPYYESTYVFVSRSHDTPVQSFDDPRLKSWRIGIQITGDDYDNPPAAQALAVRQLFNQVRGFTVYGDYSREAPERDVIDAVADGRVDVAAVWGPLAGYFAAREPIKLIVTPTPARDPRTQLPFTFAIAMAVARNAQRLREELNLVIESRHTDIDRILREYGVPLIRPAQSARGSS